MQLVSSVCSRKNIGRETPSGQAAALASNGRAVLKVLIAAAQRRPRPSIDIQHLQCELAWLPAYDRRDVMLVKEIFDELAAQQAADGLIKFNEKAAGRFAVALSVYTCAILINSPGDAPEGKALRGWLEEVGIMLDQGVGDEAHSQKRMEDRFKLKMPEERCRAGRKIGIMTWLDENPVNRMPSHSSLKHLTAELTERMNARRLTLQSRSRRATSTESADVEQIHIDKSMSQVGAPSPSNTQALRQSSELKCKDLMQLGWRVSDMWI